MTRHCDPDASFSHFRARGIEQCLDDYRNTPAAQAEKRGERLAQKLFHYASRTVPAYSRFLEKHGASIPTKRLRNIREFKAIPLLTKDNYLRSYDYAELFPKGQVAAATTIAATSGSTGEPFFFPRDEHHDRYYEHSAEVFLRSQFRLDERKTLGVIGFALGIWIGGIFTYKTLNKIAQKGCQLTLVPAGVNKDLYLRSIQKFGRYYDQLLLMGYPPFIKDVLDSGADYGIDWYDYHIKILTAAEGYSEGFRRYIAEKAGVVNILNDIINIYGTVEQGTIAHETSFANLIREIASENKSVFKALFPRASNLPTLAQYYPEQVYFEEIDGQIVASSYSSAIPLVRYAFSDLGGVIKFEEMLEKLAALGIDIFEQAENREIRANIFRLPFVYVYARSDFSVVFRGANIFPGEIRAALDDPTLNASVTGKLTLQRREDQQFNQILDVYVELKRHVVPTEELKEQVLQKIVTELLALNSEFASEYKAAPERATPHIVLCSYQQSPYFSGPGKQPWVAR